MMYNEHEPKSGQPPISKRGRLITFEGIDGSGKTTQIGHLAARLRGEGLTVRVLREPGGTRIGEAIRPILLDKRHVGMCMETELLLLAASRAQLVREIIVPDLDAGHWVICDRFHDSSAAYQGYGRGMDLAVIRSANRLAMGSCKPDLTLVLDLPVDLALTRLAGRPVKADRFDLESQSFMQRVRDGYRELVAADAERMVLLDATQPEMELAERIYRVIGEGSGR
jgi:dTMP kinase